MRYHPPITSYRLLPPKIRLIYSEDSLKTPAERYLTEVDAALQAARNAAAPDQPGDLLSLVFANQTADHEQKSRHLTHLLLERTRLSQRHLESIQAHLSDLQSRLPLRRGYGQHLVRERSELDTERQMLDLERQQRDIEQSLWRDTVELRRELATERQERQLSRARIDLLRGRYDAR